MHLIRLDELKAAHLSPLLKPIIEACDFYLPLGNAFPAFRTDCALLSPNPVFVRPSSKIIVVLYEGSGKGLLNFSDFRSTT